MKARLEVIINDDDQLDVKLENPGGVNLYTIIGVLEKLKGELVIGSPGPLQPTQEEE